MSDSTKATSSTAREKLIKTPSKWSVCKSLDAFRPAHESRTLTFVQKIQRTARGNTPPETNKLKK